MALSSKNSAAIMHQVVSLRVESGWLINACLCTLDSADWTRRLAGYGY